jgi:hypothetical protein
MQSPSPFGSPTVVHASFSTISGVSPSGISTLQENGSILGTAVVQNATATFSISGLTPGGHVLYVVYQGDDNYASAQSPALLQLIDRAYAALTLGSSQNPAPFGTPLTLIATTVRGATGTVTFRDSVERRFCHNCSFELDGGFTCD